MFVSERLTLRAVCRLLLSLLAAVALAAAALSATATPASAANVVVVNDPTFTFSYLNALHWHDPDLQAYRWNLTGRISNATATRRDVIRIKVQGLNSGGSVVSSTESFHVSKLGAHETLPWMVLMSGETITTFRISTQSIVDTSTDRSTSVVSMELGALAFTGGQWRVPATLVNSSAYSAHGYFYVAALGTSGQQYSINRPSMTLPAHSRTPYTFSFWENLPTVASVRGWVQATQTLPAPSPRPLPGSQPHVSVKSSVKVRKAFTIAGYTKAGLRVRVRTTTAPKCKVTRSGKKWRVKGKKKGVCKLALTAPGNASWWRLSQAARVRVK